MSNIFISYSHKARGPEWKRRLLEQLAVFVNHHLIDAWDDEQIPGGWRWEREIENAIHRARLAVILLTKEALESEFILEKELVPLSRREKDGLIVFPIHCEPCDCKEHSWLKQLQIRPFEAEPLSTITDETQLNRVLRRLATEIAEELGRSALAQRSSGIVPVEEVREYLEKFPLTRGPSLREEKLIGREQELALLDLAFTQPRTTIVSLVAWGGVGKSMLVQHWLLRLQRAGWLGKRRIYAWSFYSQGTKEDRQASEDMFLAHALEWFGVKCEPTLSPWDKGRLLADVISSEPTLLIWDGIEPLQYPPGPMGGQLRAPGIQSLLKHLARKANHADQQSLCLVTTREPLTDLADFQRREGSPWVSVLRVDLGNLTAEAGAALLHHAGAKRAGAAEINLDDEELLDASREVDGHALTLNLLGRFLARAHGGDIRRRDLVKFEEADRKGQGGTTFKMLAAFENWFAKSEELGERQLAVLRILGLFDQPANCSSINAIRRPPRIPRLTDQLFQTNRVSWGWFRKPQPISSETWMSVISFLRDFGLITTQLDVNDEELDQLDCHPLIREYFSNQVRKEFPQSWRAAHKRLFEHLVTLTEYRPNTLRDLQPLYNAISHACQSGLHQIACDNIYHDRILRGTDQDGFLSTHKLAAFSSEIGALAAFFVKPWSQLSENLNYSDRFWLLGQVAVRLRALGRLEEAIDPMRMLLKYDTETIVTKGSRDAATSAGNLSELEVLLGDLERAVNNGLEAVEYAGLSWDLFQRVASRVVTADALHQVGARTQADSLFSSAEQMQSIRQPQFPMLHSVLGFRLSDMILTTAERVVWQSVMSDSSNYKERCAAKSFANDTNQAIESCMRVEYRQGEIFGWREGSIWNPTLDSVLSIAVDRLSLARAGLYRYLLTGDRCSTIQSSMSDVSLALSKLREANDLCYLPYGLFTAALHDALVTNQWSSAMQLLDEAWDVASRGPMRLHMADIHLYRARLFFREKRYPWKSPRDDLVAAEKLVNDCGYHRRDEELADAKRAILGV